MPTFTPPTSQDRPTTTLEGNHPGDSLMRHFAPLTRGRNVYILPDGTVTESDGSVDWSTQNSADVFYGGHTHTVTTAQQAILVAAGYTVT